MSGSLVCVVVDAMVGCVGGVVVDKSLGGWLACIFVYGRGDEVEAEERRGSEEWKRK